MTATTPSTQWTEAVVREKLNTDIRWADRALLVLLDRQTSDEQASQITVHANSRGFNSCDAAFMTSVAQGMRRYGRGMTDGQWTRIQGRLGKYWRQIVEEIELKEAALSDQRALVLTN